MVNAHDGADSRGAVATGCSRLPWGARATRSWQPLPASPGLIQPQNRNLERMVANVYQLGRIFNNFVAMANRAI